MIVNRDSMLMSFKKVDFVPLQNWFAQIEESFWHQLLVVFNLRANKNKVSVRNNIVVLNHLKYWWNLYLIAFKIRHWRKHHISFVTAFCLCKLPRFVPQYNNVRWEKWKHNYLLNSMSTREKQRAWSREQHVGFMWLYVY